MRLVVGDVSDGKSKTHIFRPQSRAQPRQDLARLSSEMISEPIRLRRLTSSLTLSDLMLLLDNATR